MPLPKTFNKDNFRLICDKLASRDKDLKKIIKSYGYPPCWQRAPGFETLVYIILEQQVSLASAKAAYLKLKEKLVSITPQALLQLNDDELKACYFSRQKIVYTRHLAALILSKELDIDSFSKMDSEHIRSALMKVKGIGSWTADVYLMMALQRTDLFPAGDVALIRSIKEVKRLNEDHPKEEILKLSAKWKPYQTIAAYILWHAYLSKRQKVPG